MGLNSGRSTSTCRGESGCEERCEGVFRGLFVFVSFVAVVVCLIVVRCGVVFRLFVRCCVLRCVFVHSCLILEFQTDLVRRSECYSQQRRTRNERTQVCFFVCFRCLVWCAVVCLSWLCVVNCVCVCRDKKAIDGYAASECIFCGQQMIDSVQVCSPCVVCSLRCSFVLVRSFVYCLLCRMRLFHCQRKSSRRKAGKFRQRTQRECAVCVRLEFA